MSTSSASLLTDFKSLPIIDISGLFSSDFKTRLDTAQQLGKAAREVGFLYITGHGISTSTCDALLTMTKDYFAQSDNDKLKHYIGNSSNHSGYVPIGEETFASGSYDLKEAYDIGYDYLALTGRKPMLGPVQWPDFPDFKNAVSNYYQAAFKLGQTLFQGFALALGLDEHYFDSIVTTPPSQLRLIHYPFNPTIEDRPGIGAHTDYECFTILLPTADGLEVLNGAGEWIDAPVIEGALVINIGDMLEILSNGQFIATSHRVRKVKQERYSFPLFCACDYDTLISPMPHLTNSSGRQYSSLRCGDHLYAQTMQIFSYLKKRLANGEIQLPDNAQALSSFGQEASQQSLGQ